MRSTAIGAPSKEVQKVRNRGADELVFYLACGHVIVTHETLQDRDLERKHKIAKIPCFECAQGKRK